ncbi:unnamed protein product [Diabrotica balteata]|uniref:E3 ubiquitin-protein ligase TRIM9 n=2 Tax=Diabrotica TaxID=50385 RepID=A0A9N9XAK6_DIABA|nr:unnamed protein product [Diabrotica balteata]
MDEELCCPACKQFFSNPVLLPCHHSLCLLCAIHLQQPANTHNTISTLNSVPENAESVTSGSSGDYQESDKLSILSETDSGVICASRPNSYIENNLSVASTLSVACPVCHKLVYFDENGVHNLPKYRIMQNIVEKYSEIKNLSLKCQMCEKEPANDATVMCEQCEVRYCTSCRESCHPLRGPLAKHVLSDPKRGLNSSTKGKTGNCPEHVEETLNMFCSICKICVCAICLLDTRHISHDVQPATVICKIQKTDLSHNLQQLSERARTTTEFIQQLKGLNEEIEHNCDDFENIISGQCQALIEAIHERRNHLIEFIRQEKEMRKGVLKDQVASCTQRLQQTTALLQFCIEALKETDSSSFLQIGSMLINRVVDTDHSWLKEWSVPQVSPQFELTLDDAPVLTAIKQLNFIQSKPPVAPIIIPEECNAENNSVTVAWQPPSLSHVEGYVLELDDGNGGDFREVYCGNETICTVDGLHFRSLYNARVKAFNSTGEGEYSELIGLQTADVAWFTFDPVLSGPGLQYSENNTRVTGEGWEHRVALGSLGFSRGLHYWEFTIEKYDTDTDPSFGVARIDVTRDKMLGKDDKGWAMYIDNQRSWFQHAGAHEQRVEGGIQIGSTVGVLLDLEQHTLSFYVNEEPQGSVAFRDLYGVFYPAVSINRGVSITVHTSLDPPSDLDETQ